MTKPVPVEIVVRARDLASDAIRRIGWVTKDTSTRAKAAIAAMGRGFSSAAASARRGWETAITSIKNAILGLPGIVAALGTGTFALLGRQLVKTASDAEELGSKFGVLFEDVRNQAELMADATASAVGRSKMDIREYMSTVQNLLTPLGLAGDEGLQLSNSLAQLAVDLASFNNAADEEALLAIRSALTGESEPLRRFGVTLTEAKVQAEALTLGLAKNKDELSEQAKLLARVSIITRETAKAQGDAIRTSDSYANSVKRLQADVKDLSVSFGKELIAAIQDTIRSLGGTEAVTGMVRIGLRLVVDVLKSGIVALGEFGRWLVAVVQQLGGVDEASRVVAEGVRGFVAGIVTAARAAQVVWIGLARGVDTVIIAVKGAGRAIAIVLEGWVAIFYSAQAKIADAAKGISGFFDWWAENVMGVDPSKLNRKSAMEAWAEDVKASAERGLAIVREYDQRIAGDLGDAWDGYLARAKESSDELSVVWKELLASGETAISSTQSVWTRISDAMKAASANAAKGGGAAAGKSWLAALTEEIARQASSDETKRKLQEALAAASAKAGQAAGQSAGQQVAARGNQNPDLGFYGMAAVNGLTMVQRAIKDGQSALAGFAGGWREVTGLTNQASRAFAAWRVGAQAAAKVHDAFASSVGELFAEMADGGKNIGQVWDNLKRRVVMAIGEMIAKMLAMKATQALFSFFGFTGPAPSSGGNFANGGIGASVRRALPLRGAAVGGVTNGPTMMIAGEGRYPREAFVPLPDGKNIPVVMKGGGGGGMNNYYFSVQATDASSFDALLMQRRDKLVGMMQEATIRNRGFREAFGAI